MLRLHFRASGRREIIDLRTVLVLHHIHSERFERRSGALNIIHGFGFDVILEFPYGNIRKSDLPVIVQTVARHHRHGPVTGISDRSVIQRYRIRIFSRCLEADINPGVSFRQRGMTELQFSPNIRSRSRQKHITGRVR
ncbi:hypothetical protein D3C81_752520 [compost metagenome]